MTAVSELLPGDRAELGGQGAVFIAAVPHPCWPRLRLVIWRLDDGSWSLDALAARQEIGEAAASGAGERWARVRAAFSGR
jgi:hypothetical protein